MYLEDSYESSKKCYIFRNAEHYGTSVVFTNKANNGKFIILLYNANTLTWKIKTVFAIKPTWGDASYQFYLESYPQEIPKYQL